MSNQNSQVSQSGQEGATGATASAEPTERTRTLGQVACEACEVFYRETGGWAPDWSRRSDSDRTAFERAAAAVIAEYERRRSSHTIASTRVVSEPGAAITETVIELTGNARKGLGLPPKGPRSFRSGFCDRCGHPIDVKPAPEPADCICDEPGLGK